MSHHTSLVGALSLLSASWLAMPIPASALPGAPLGPSLASPAAAPGLEEAAFRRCGRLPDGRLRPCCPPLLRGFLRKPDLLGRCVVHRPHFAHPAHVPHAHMAHVPRVHAGSHEDRAHVHLKHLHHHKGGGGHMGGGVTAVTVTWVVATWVVATWVAATWAADTWAAATWAAWAGEPPPASRQAPATLAGRR